MQRWLCTRKACPNYDKTCLVIADEHFKLFPVHLRTWNDAIIAGKASVDSVPITVKPVPINEPRSGGGGSSGPKSPSTKGGTNNVTNFYTYYNSTTPIGNSQGGTIQHQQTHQGDQQTQLIAPTSPVLSDAGDPKDQINDFINWNIQRTPTLVADLERIRPMLLDNICTPKRIYKMTDDRWDILKIPPGIGWLLQENVKSYSDEKGMRE
jgi:hypothetical protein